MSIAIRSKLFGLAATSLLAGSGAAHAAGGELKDSEQALLFGTSFEVASLSDFNIAGNPPVITSDHTRAGTRSLKTYLHRQESSVAYRTEVRVPGHDTIGEEYWYGFSVLLPSPFPADNLMDIVAQWHGHPDAGEENQNPPLQLNMRDGKWQIKTTWNAIQPTIKANQQSVMINVGTPQTDQWTDWVFRVKWSYGSDGILQVWKNGDKVVDRTGPNCFNDEQGLFFKLGLYKPSWKEDRVWSGRAGTVDERTIYHDELRVAGKGASYADVAPRGGSSRPVPPKLSVAGRE